MTMGEALEQEVELTDFNDETHGWHIHKILLNHRKGSASAKTDVKSITERPCFLCLGNRPKEQRRVLWRDYEILVNPYPVADDHLTIACRTHTPQRICGRIGDMAELARLLPDRCIFYNGPRCGASAPDHMHFQAFKQIMSLNIWMHPENLEEIVDDTYASLFVPKKGESAFPFFIIISDNKEGMEKMFETVCDSLPKSEDDEEPMMNIVMLQDNDGFRAFIVPRKAHRPSCYGSDEGSMLISPASVEMLGTFITSRQEDFNRLDLDTVNNIYREVCLPAEEFGQICDNIINRFK